jgi:hypothetical protein
MCSLCGMLGDQVHWTDSKRPTPEAHAQRRERQVRVRLVNTLLQHYGLTLAEWSGTSYVLSSRTGRTALVENLSDLWGQAERLCGRHCDPLDERLLVSLERASR